MSTAELLYPKALLELVEDDEVHERDTCTVPRALWTKWTRNQTAEVLLVELKQRDVKHFLVIDNHHTRDLNTIYMPSRILQEFDSEEYLLVSVVTEMPPKATKITLQPLDNELYHCDIATAVGEYLSSWHILKKHTTLTVPLKELGGFLVDIFVKDIEPAELVLLRGEVPLELAESVETVQEWNFKPEAKKEERPPTPIPDCPFSLGNRNPIVQTDGQMIPDECTQPAKRSRTDAPTFTPFSGVGRRLCDP